MQDPGQIGPVVKPILRLGQVSGSVFYKVESMVRSAGSSLEIADYGIDPLEARHIGTLSFSSNDDLHMTDTHFLGGAEAFQSVGDHDTIWREVAPRPIANFLEAKGFHARKYGAFWMDTFIDL